MSAVVPRPLPGISRRRFLAGSAVLAASASVVGGFALREGPNALARLAASDVPRLWVGFVDGAATLAEAAGATAVPAGSVATGDPALLGRSVQVRVHGMTPGLDEAIPSGVQGLALDALVPSPLDRERKTLPFYAWSMRRSPLQHSSPVAFAAATDTEPTLGLRLAVRSGEPASPPAADAVAVFTAGRDAGLPKLREGLFLVGVNPTTWRERRRLPAVEDRAWRGLASIVLSVHPAP